MNGQDYYFVDKDYFWGHFASLNEHLQEVRPSVDEFCTRNNFDYVDRRSIGRNPRIRIQRVGHPALWFDLWMELDKNGQRFEVFQRDIPYELSCGALHEDGDVRFFKMLECFSGKPFDQVGAVLLDEMDKALRILEEWDVEYLRESGESELVELNR